MNNLPNDIILNIIIKKYEEEKLQTMELNAELNRELISIKLKIDNMEYDNQRMIGYLEQNEVKYCDECRCYGNDDEIIHFEENQAYLCEYCKEWYDEQTEENGETHIWSS
tara:strand:+ start:9340 stop:9669 length:330 start_codon:yes stop_codon:yes gene_type:complete